MSNVFGKFREIMGIGDDYEEDFEDLEDSEVEDDFKSEVEPIVSKKKGANVVNIHSAATAKVVVIRPTSYEEAREISDALKSRKIVLVNATALETKLAQRLVDFISGSAYVLEATLQEIEHRVYLVSPSNVEVTNELKSELSSKALFSWNK